MADILIVLSKPRLTLILVLRVRFFVDRHNLSSTFTLNQNVQIRIKRLQERTFLPIIRIIKIGTGIPSISMCVLAIALRWFKDDGFCWREAQRLLFFKTIPNFCSFQIWYTALLTITMSYMRFCRVFNRLSRKNSLFGVVNRGGFMNNGMTFQNNVSIGFCPLMSFLLGVCPVFVIDLLLHPFLRFVDEFCDVVILLVFKLSHDGLVDAIGWFFSCQTTLLFRFAVLLSIVVKGIARRHCLPSLRTPKP